MLLRLAAAVDVLRRRVVWRPLRAPPLIELAELVVARVVPLGAVAHVGEVVRCFVLRVHL